MSTVSHAERYGKPVFAVPGSIYSPDSAGTNRLLHEGRARAACSGADLVQALGLQASAAPEAEIRQPDPMTDTERRPVSGRSRWGWRSCACAAACPRPAY